MSSANQDDLIREKLQEFRAKLLDLTGRNPLLNFRLSSEKAKTHIRVIDELPDFLFGTFREGKKFTFQSLPPLNNEPHDETDKKFQNAFRQAQCVDEQYLQEIDALADKEDTFEEVALIERKLKNRLREQLGMPPLKELKPLSNADWARKYNLVPQYDMPLPQQDDKQIGKAKHNDYKIQTLLLPKELDNKLQGLKRHIKTDINELGVNTFYIAFGFLQWYDQDNSEKPFFAPLVLLQLDPLTEMKTNNGEIVYSIQASGEEPHYNLSLAAKLKDFGLELPKLDGEDTPERYMKKIECLIKNKLKWKVRRFITIGRFQFSRLVMYQDLDPANWPPGKAINDNPIIKSLLGGYGVGGNGGTGDLQSYDIDRDPDVEKHAPVLITEADSSQHSAIVDALKGNNLVIKGPPGTGKSQTITNLVANALAKGKTVLFIAEKMAALDVVYSRLKKAGLGDFSLELHSTKSKLKDVRENLERALENRKHASRPRDLAEKIDQLKKARTHLRDYSDALHQPLGNMRETVYKILWAERSRRDHIRSQLRNISIKDADTFSSAAFSSLQAELQQFEALAQENATYDSAEHPWKGVNSSHISSLKIDDIIQVAEESLADLETLVSAVGNFEAQNTWSLGNTFEELDTSEKQWSEIAEYKVLLSRINFHLLAAIANPHNFALAQQFEKQLEKYATDLKKSQDTLKHPEKIAGKQEEIKSLYQQAKKLWVDFTTGQIFNSF
jgi:hypothetical protein